MKIVFVNHGVENIDYLIRDYDGKEATDTKVAEMKSEIYDSFINNQYIDFTIQGEGAHIVDVETLDNCEILIQ